MEKIAIVTEDVCSLPQKIIDNLEIEIVKTKLYFPSLEKFPEKNLYQLMKETKEIPKTASPSPGDYLQAYKKALEKNEKVLVITISSKLSACFKSALQAREFFPDPPRIYIFDSKQAVAGQGLLVIKAKELIESGKKIEEILENLKEISPKIKLLGFIGTPFWAKRTGRVNQFTAFTFSFLKSFGIWPFFTIKDGKVTFGGFNFWSKNLLKIIPRQISKQKYKGFEVGINFTDNIEIALELREILEKKFSAKIHFVSQVPPIVGAASGPGTLILAFLPQLHLF